MDEEVVVETTDVKEDTLVIEEKLREEGKILCEELVFLAIDLEDGVARVRVNELPRWVGIFVLA